MAQNNQHNDAVIIGLSAVLVSVRDDNPVVFIVRGAKHALNTENTDERYAKLYTDDGDALPFGPFDPVGHRTLQEGLRSWVSEQTPIDPGYIEQLYTFGDKSRYAGAELQNSTRVVSIGYLGLTYIEEDISTETEFWQDIYKYFPWEDWRQGRPAIIDELIAPYLNDWISEGEDKATRELRQKRVSRCFGLNDIRWNDEIVLERYELLYEARLVVEALRLFPDANPYGDDLQLLGRPMQFDHRRILATALGRLRGKVKYRPVFFELMPEEFTLLELQRTVEAIGGAKLHKQNFRRLVEQGGLVEETGATSTKTGGRPASLFRFRRDVTLERLAPGVKMRAQRG